VESELADASFHLLWASWMEPRCASWMEVEFADASWMESEIFDDSAHLHSASSAESVTGDVYLHLAHLEERLTSVSGSGSESESMSESESESESESGIESEMNDCWLNSSETHSVHIL